MSSPISAPAQNEFLDMRTAGKDSDPANVRIGKVRPTISWQTFFSNAYRILLALTSSGATTARPTQNLYIGQMYFDTTLGLPVWLKSYSAGAAVWVNASGTPV